MSNASDISAGENILLKKAANIKRRFEYAGGWVIVTDKAVVLKPHKLNISNKADRIELASITKVGKYKQFGLIPTGVVITTNDGQEYRFICWGRQKVIEIIKRTV